MNHITIYKAEAKDNLVDKLLAGTSIAYVCKIDSCLDQDILNTKILGVAGKNIDSNDLLYPTKSILATTSWNKNDDVFAVSETWSARHTPKDKPTNIEHDHTKIVGHITNTWAITEDGNILDDDTLSCDLPDLFHLCNGAVIYKYSPDDGIQEQADKLIKEIEAGTKFVSMECLFPAFDYAISSDDKSYVISRNDSTAFLTKHLRAYGGDGEYNGCRVGRLIKNMVFSGKGYVDTPANPDSIIFDGSSPVPLFSKSKLENGYHIISKSSIGTSPTKIGTISWTTNSDSISNNVIVDNGVINPKEHNSMADNEFKNQLDEQKQLIVDLRKANEDLTDQIANANVDKFTAEITDLKQQVVTANDKAVKSTEDLTEAKSKVETLEAKIVVLTEANDSAKATIEKIEAEKLQVERVALLVSGGLEKSSADEKVKKFAYLSNEQFTEVAEAIVEANTSTASDVEDNEDDNSDDESVLDTAEADDDSSNVGAIDSNEEDSELEVAKAGIASYFSKKFGDNTSEDNE